MNFDFDERQDRIDQLSKLLSVMQDVARKLANESHGRSYDKARELNEILHRARLQMDAIETAERWQVQMERRRAPRTNFES
ncbi:MAG: hypothetical protein HYX45_15220 [Burkholderiales bacterium]|nr:hypothetical protein [Burkholderiales bacterium]MCZ8292926.1 hypothetical protein [Hylemonella sp.]